MSHGRTSHVMVDGEDYDDQNPLRGLMQAEADGDLAICEVIPQQPHSIHDEIVNLSFPNVNWVSNPIIITLAVDATPGCGGVAWPAGEVLANYLTQKGREPLHGKEILELGSGTGLVGLVAGKLGADVCITDQAALLETMERNVMLNNLSGSVVVAELNWGSPIPQGIPRPDIILAADCVYFEPAFPLLVQTLSDLADPSTCIFFCYKKRRKADKHFFLLLKKKFTWDEVMDDENRQAYVRESISLLRLYKRAK